MKMQITLNIFETMALVTAIYYLGKFLRTKVNFLSKYCIPAPVVGGLVFAIITLILKLTNLGYNVLRVSDTFNSFSRYSRS